MATEEGSWAASVLRKRNDYKAGLSAALPGKTRSKEMPLLPLICREVRKSLGQSGLLADLNPEELH